MSDHLPECLLASDCKHEYYDEPPIQCANCGEECLCNRLRACEARVRRDVDDVWVTQHSDHITWEWKGDTGYALVQREVLELLLARCNEPTYAAGVQAARDAVAALPGTGTTVPGEGKVLGRAAALAAIDALRGES